MTDKTDNRMKLFETNCPDLKQSRFAGKLAVRSYVTPKFKQNCLILLRFRLIRLIIALPKHNQNTSKT